MKKNLLNSVRQTFHHGFIYGFGSILTRSIGFFLIPLYTRHLNPSHYGTLSILTITSYIAIAIFKLGFNSAFFRSYYDYKDTENRKRVISTTFYILLMSSTILILLGFYISPYLSKLLFGTLQYTKYFYLIFFTASFNILKSFFYLIYRAKKLSKQYTIYNILFFILRLSLIIYFVAIAKKGVWGVIISLFLVSFIGSTTLLFSIRKDIILSFSKYDMVKLLSFGIPLIPQALSSYILVYSDSFFIKYFNDIADVGLYNLGYKFGILVQTFLVFPLAMIWSPMMLSVKDEKFANEYYSRALTYFLLIGALVILGISLFSEEIIRIMAEKSFRASYKVVPLIALSYLFLGTQRIFNVGISLKRKTKYSAIVFVVTAIMNLILNYLLIPQYGMMGAAMATCISYFLLNVIKYPISSKLYYVRYEWGRILKITFLSIIIFFIGYFIKIETLFLSILFKLLLIGCFPIVLWIIHFFDRKEMTTIMQYQKKLFKRIKFI